MSGSPTMKSRALEISAAVLAVAMLGGLLWWQGKGSPASGAQGQSSEKLPAKSDRAESSELVRPPSNGGTRPALSAKPKPEREDGDMILRWQEMMQSSASTVEFAKLLRAIHRRDQFEAALGLISEMSPGEEREIMTMALFANPHVDFAILTESLKQLPGKDERARALGGMRAAFQGRDPADLNPEVLAALDREILSSVADGLGRELTGMHLGIEIDPAGLKQRVESGVTLFDKMIASAPPGAQAGEVQVAKMQFLAKVAYATPELAFEVFDRMPLDLSDVEGPYADASLKLVRSLVEADPPNYMGKILASSHGQQKGVMVAALDAWLRKDLAAAGDWVDKEYSNRGSAQQDEMAWAMVHAAKRMGDAKNMNRWLDEIRDPGLKERVAAFARH